jgi:hypothetical protein
VTKIIAEAFMDGVISNYPVCGFVKSELTSIKSVTCASKRVLAKMQIKLLYGFIQKL